MYSPEAWQRHTRLNGKLLDRLLPPGGKILQMSKEYFPHPGYRDMEYYVFINYNARLARDDGFTPWRPHPRKEPAFIALQDELFRCATHIFTAGEYLRQNIIETSGVRPEKITSVGNGVPPEYERNAPAEFPEEFTHRLLFVGWDFGLKGGRDVLAAMPAIRARHPKVELFIVGPDEAQKQQQGTLADQPGVHWISGKVSLDHYRSADLFVLPSLRDSYGFVFLEAMSQGLPCIGADVNGMPEMIADSETGYIVPRSSPEAIAHAVDRYYTDPSNKKRMAEASRRRVESLFTWDVVMNKINAVMGLEG
ncbi:MAG TPA: glycosyltransferase family 4 protein [Kiritimatiellia bacterium]|nr:glycosyltransferase family 4 protein [Kiritimatiellia bacterium]HMO98656.1 glycosyltransferase family 4 protein [Kiritimatiellia bacterium]